MKRASPILNQTPSSAHPLRAETRLPSPPPSASCLPRLTLGGAICGSFVGSFAGALLGVAVGAVFHDISFGLDGALLGGGVTAGVGAAYGLILALSEKGNPSSPTEEVPSS